MKFWWLKNRTILPELFTCWTDGGGCSNSSYVGVCIGCGHDQAWELLNDREEPEYACQACGLIQGEDDDGEEQHAEETEQQDPV